MGKIAKNVSDFHGGYHVKVGWYTKYWWYFVNKLQEKYSFVKNIISKFVYHNSFLYKSFVCICTFFSIILFIL